MRHAVHRRKFRLMITIGPHGRNLPDGPRAPCRPFARCEPVSINLGDPGFPEYVQVFKLIHSAIRVGVPAAVLPAWVLDPDSAVIKIQSGCVSKVLEEPPDQA